MRCGKLAIVTDSLTNAEGWQSVVVHILYLLSAPLSALRRGEQVMQGEAKGTRNERRGGRAEGGGRGGDEIERVTFRGIMSL